MQELAGLRLPRAHNEADARFAHFWLPVSAVVVTDNAWMAMVTAFILQSSTTVFTRRP